MKRSTRKRLTNTLSKLVRITEVQLTEAKAQDHVDYISLDAIISDQEYWRNAVDSSLQSLIQKTEKNVRRKKLLTSGFSVLGYGFIVSSFLSLPFAFSHPNQTMLFLPIALALMAYPAFHFSNKSRNESIAVSEEEILENYPNPNEASRELAILNAIREQKLSLFGKDIDGRFWEYSPEVLKTENWRLFLLSGIKTKSVLFLEGWFPNKGLYLLKSDSLKLRQKVDRKSKASTAGVLRQRSRKKAQKPKNSKNYERPKILDELAKNTRFSPFLKCLLWKKSNANKFLRKVAKVKAASSLSPARTRYFCTIQYIVENWETWKLYAKGTLKGHLRRNFEAELLVSLKGSREFKRSDEDLLNDFITADMRSFDSWLEELKVVPSEDVIKVTTDYLSLKKKSRK